MDLDYSRNNLINLSKKILLNQLNEEDFNKYLLYLYSKEDFTNIEEDIYHLIILNLINTNSKLQELIKNDVILNIAQCYILQDSECCKCQEEITDIKNFYENKITSFSNEQIDFPPEGETIIIHHRDNSSFPGKSYLMDFLIDSTGKVLKMVGEPIEVINNKPDFKDTYAGIVGQILEYQKVNAD